ncbi:MULTISPECIES: DUF5412 domain-containing protein [Niallia]|uniref:DUF5412 domain-containing protein n=2 Tax=Niallia TaxID=2837506 RepID=A0A941GGL7_NIACI|nr:MULTISPECIES: DUF5412 domain-containing protein [Niallia]EOR22291.1 hypothetical protein A499_18796 [Niallia nealsonii AAU1]MCB5239622.1 DUF5412 domain-containing protein [Niallia circulans]MED3794323.1 DUF5412 domain-containing protein [Niallia alba]NMO76519.1 DUF5412 domain-containing protein [Niallia alba]UTI44236.1 DUF5412 domain-containing protein [Niallia sp. RD1]
MNTNLSNTNKKRNKGLTVIVISLILLGLIGYAVYWAFYDMNRLPKGEYLTEETSPDGTYTLKAYLVNGGATTSYAIRGELVLNNKDNKTKNVYWNNNEETATIEWTDKNTVVVNGHTLHAPKDRFDYRK